MEFLSPAWWSALMAIILIDLVLAGDNAIVIALAARNLPKHLQRKAIIWGTAGEPVLSQWFGTREAPVKVLRYALMALCVAGVLGTAWLATRRKAAALPAQTDADPQA